MQSEWMQDIGLDSILKYTPLFPWVAVLVGGVPLEGVLPHGREQPHRRSTVPNLINGMVVTVMAFFLLPVIFSLTAETVHCLGGGLIDLQVPMHNEMLSQIIPILLLLVISDFFFYWWHRAEHCFLFLWHIHAVHHSDTDFNITTYARQHWLETNLQAVFIGLPMAVLFKFSSVNFFAVLLIMASWDFFSHMNIRFDMGRFTGVFVGPQYHRIHHSLERAHQDVNFSQFFPVFDMMFSTYCPPKKYEYPLTGLYSGEILERPMDLFLWPFRKYWEAICGFIDRLRSMS
ncbi:MAG: sterol desaturase family protein [Proteobacteria bacterium]|nr:sterol desaturase family protein [Pseudomonadota bacterium]